jgi:hypothetical protein
MTDGKTLIVEILDFWHCGTGKGSGEHLDALADRDSRGLPHVPGKMLKGLLRDAVGLCEAFGQLPAGTQLELFGGGAGQPAQPGCLRVADALLPKELAGWLLAEAGAEARAALSRDLFATAVDPVTGVAAGRSLRGLEAIVPLLLRAEIGPLPGRTAPDDWADRLRKALPLVRALGHQRSRGLGRCQLRFEGDTP